MRLYHYSNADIKDKIKVSYYGQNYFTANDKAITNVKRAFFYTKPEPEALLRHSKFLYIVDYPIFRLYDISKDLRGYLRHRTIPEALRKIKQNYNGIRYNIGNNEIVNLFYDTKIKDKITLTK